MSLIGLWCKYQGNEIFSQQLLIVSFIFSFYARIFTNLFIFNKIYFNKI